MPENKKEKCVFYFDAHCHVLPLKQMKRSADAGVSYFICNATQPNDWLPVIDLAGQVTGVYPCVGVHPWFIDTLPSDWQIQMQLLLEKHPSLMIGEIGLDGTKPCLTKQAEIFETCLKLARQYKRPVHIHGHKAWVHILDILTCFPDVQCLFHRFSGSEVQARQLSDVTNAYFSVMTAKPLRYLPSDRILIESDSPDGLHKPIRVVELAERLGLDWFQLNQNFCSFIGNRLPFKGNCPTDGVED